MLKFLRKRENIKKIMWVLAILIIPAFVLWGSGSMLRSKGLPQYAGTIFGQEITFRQYETQFLATRNDALLRYGDNINQVAQYLDFDALTWERLILLYEAGKQNIEVSDEEVVNVLRSLPLFQRDGRFHQATYITVLEYAFGASPRQFEEQIRDTLMIEKLKVKVTNHINVSDEEIQQAYKEENEKAKARYIFVDPADFTEQVHPAYEELETYYQQNKNEFKKPEQVNVQYVGLHLDQAQELFPQEVTEAEIIEYYQEHPEEFSTQEETQNQAENEGEEEIIDPEGLTASNDVQNDQLKTEEEKNQIKEKLVQEKSRIELEDKMWEVADQIAENPEAFEDIAKSNNLKVKETDFFGPQDLIPEIGLSYEFLNTAFSLDPGQISDVIETANGNFVLKVKEKKQTYIPRLDEIKEELESAVIAEHARQLAKEKAYDLLSQMKELLQDSNVDFEKAAEKLSLQVQDTDQFSRTSYIPGIGRSEEFAQAVFALEIGAISDVLEAPMGFCIVRLQEIIPIDENSFAQEKEQYSQKILLAKKNEFFNNWQENLIAESNLENNLARLKNPQSP